MATPTMTLQLDPATCTSASADLVLYASTTGQAVGFATASGLAIAGVRKDTARPLRSVVDGVTNTTTTVTSATAAFTYLDIGRGIAGSGIPAGAYVVSITSATSVVISAAATATASTVTLTLGTLGLLVFRELNPNAGRSVADAVTVSGDATVTAATAVFTAEDVGQPITGSGIPTGTTVASRNSATSIELSANATASGTGVTITVTSDDTIDDPTGSAWRLVVQPNSSSAKQTPVFFHAPDEAGFHDITTNLATEPGSIAPSGTQSAALDGDVGGTVGANTINPEAVTTDKIADDNITTPKVADANLTMPLLVIEDEDGLAFRFDPSTLDDADTLPAPWVSANTIAGLETFEDDIGIRDGKIAQLTFPGANYPGPGMVSGWRTIAVADLPWSDGFMARATVDNTVPSLGGGPAVLFVEDDVDHGVGTYIVPDVLEWHELGPIGLEPTDFRYLDTCPSDLIFDDPANVEVIIYVLHGWIWSTVDGIRRCGPVRIPEGLVGSRKHGVQTDYALDTPDGCIKLVEFQRYDGPVALDFPPAVITGSATVTKGTAATSRAIPITDNSAAIEIGHQLGMWVTSNATITTPDGWDLDPSTATTGNHRLRFYTHLVDGTETWFGLGGQTLTVVHGSSISAGVIVNMTEANQHRPCTATLLADTENSTTASIPSQVAWGPHRSSMICVAVNADRTVTFSTGWTPLAATAPGGAAITLAVAIVADWSDPPAPLELSEDYVFGGRETGAQTATLSSASACLTGHVMVGPNQEGAPSE